MVYLIISIIAVLVIVTIAIRRLPYLRPTRLGLEINAARPFQSFQASPWTSWWNHIKAALGGGFMIGRRPAFHSRPPLATDPSYAVATPLSSDEVNSALPEGMSMTAHPGDFWQDTPEISAGALEIPAKGLITRRGEAQKIAHELISHADEAFRKKDFKSAEKYYLQAATKDPDNARIYNRLGVIYLQTKNYKDAIEAFRGSLKFDDRVASRHFNLALAYLGKRDYRSAEKVLREALRLEPTNDKYRKTLDALQKQPA